MGGFSFLRKTSTFVGEERFKKKCCYGFNFLRFADSFAFALSDSIDPAVQLHILQPLPNRQANLIIRPATNDDDDDDDSRRDRIDVRSISLWIGLVRISQIYYSSSIIGFEPICHAMPYNAILF